MTIPLAMTMLVVKALTMSIAGIVNGIVIVGVDHAVTSVGIAITLVGVGSPGTEAMTSNDSTAEFLEIPMAVTSNFLVGSAAIV